MNRKIQKFQFVLFALFFALASVAYVSLSHAEKPAVIYSSVIEDLPLMPGMVEDASSAVVFDKPGGRIIEFSVQTRATRAEIATFYNGTLPSLGWKPVAPSAYSREGEVLVITVGSGVAQFKLSPAEKK